MATGTQAQPIPAPSVSTESPRSLKTTPYPRVVGQGMWAIAKMRVRQWDRLMQSNARIEQVQLQMMKNIVERAAQTKYGKKLGIGDVRTYQEWTQRVPIADYDYFVPYFERMMKGERNVLVPGFVKHFGNSAGSSGGGRQKFLPITELQVELQQKASADACYRYLVEKGDREYPAGFTVGLFPPTVMKQKGPVTITNNPALMFANLPLFARPTFIPKGHIKNEEDYDKKLQLIAENYLDYNVHAVSGTTCWFSLLFDKLLEAARKRGRSVSTVGELWPNLRVLFGGGVAADPYIPVIRERIGNDRVSLVDTYNATEGGLFACTDHSGEPGMLMIPDRGVFFEFVPLDEIDRANPTRVPLWGVETGKNYVIIVSTVSGMFSYKLGDIVRFSSTSPLRMEFAGRLAGCLSTTQELTTHVEVQSAVSAALEQHPAVTVDYTCGADVGVDGTSKARYTLFVEFAEKSPDLRSFADAFDKGLINVNRVYREHRNGDTAILPADVISLPPGTVGRFMEKAGMTSVQTKFPRIVNDHQKEILRSLLD